MYGSVFRAQSIMMLKKLHSYQTFQNEKAQIVDEKIVEASFAPNNGRHRRWIFYSDSNHLAYLTTSEKIMEGRRSKRKKKINYNFYQSFMHKINHYRLFSILVQTHMLWMCHVKEIYCSSRYKAWVIAKLLIAIESRLVIPTFSDRDCKNNIKVHFSYAWF